MAGQTQTNLSARLIACDPAKGGVEVLVDVTVRREVPGEDACGGRAARLAG